MNFIDRFEQCYVDKLPEACVGCPFLGVDNKLWAGIEKGYISTQWCNVSGKHMEERMFESRHKDCPLKLVEELYDKDILEEPIYDFPLEDSIPPLDYYEKPWKYTDNDEYAEEYNQELIDQVNRRKMRQEDLPIKEQFKMVFDKYKRQIEEKVLFDILTRFYFADWTRQCDYENMTSEEIVNVVMDVCRKIEKDYKYSVDDDLCPMPWDFTIGDNDC